MKRSTIALATFLVLGSFAAQAQTVTQPSFNDFPDYNPQLIAGPETLEQSFPKGSQHSGPQARVKPALVVDANERRAQQLASVRGDTRSDAVTGSGRPYPSLNDTFRYPAY
jgi:hypothetical protein